MQAGLAGAAVPASQPSAGTGTDVEGLGALNHAVAAIKADLDDLRKCLDDKTDRSELDALLSVSLSRVARL